MENHIKKIETLKIKMSVLLMVFACIMVVASFFAPPLGIIDNSVLIIFGEISAFAGSVFGISMVYSTKHKQLEVDIKKRLDNIEKGKGGN